MSGCWLVGAMAGWSGAGDAAGVGAGEGTAEVAGLCAGCGGVRTRGRLGVGAGAGAGDNPPTGGTSCTGGLCKLGDATPGA
eukprot:8437726-Karenia_brevis.AAC.1